MKFLILLSLLATTAHAVTPGVPDPIPVSVVSCDGGLSAPVFVSVESGCVEPDAVNLSFTPSTPGDWSSVPSTVQGALDYLAGAGSGGSVWGSITGTLSDQTDLNSALGGKVPTTRTVNGHALNANVTVTKSDVSLSNVTDDAQLKASDLDTDGTFTANSDSKVPSQKASKTYSDGKVVNSLSGSQTDKAPSVSSVNSALANHPSNTFEVDCQNGNDTTGTGTATAPYLTIGKAATVIGTASSNADFNDVSKRFYLVRAHGSCTESPTFGTRPEIVLEMLNATIIGNLTVQIDQGTIFGAGLQSPSFTIRGPNARGVAGGAPTSGITGNLVYESINSGSSSVAQMHLFNAAITGNVSKIKTGGAGGYTLTLFLEGSVVQGTIAESTGNSGITLYADNCNDSSSNSLGGVTGAVTLNVLNDVRFNGAVVSTATTHGRWFNVEFKSGQAHDFSAFSGSASVDANTYESFQANVSTKGTGTFTRLDSARGIKNTAAGNISSTDVQSAINELDSEKEPALPSGTSAQYIGGDKSLHTLNTLAVAENTNLYFTPARANAALPQLATYHVDKAGADSVSCGTISSPCLTIQQALTNVGDAASAADVKLPKTVMIGAGAYDESITIPRGRIITLVAQGTVILGAGTGSNWSSTTPRSVTANFYTADVFGSDIKPALNIVAFPASDATSTFTAEAGMFLISGNLVINGDGLTNTLNTSSVKVAGTFQHITAALTNWQSYRSLFTGAITTTGNLVLERAYDSRFNALVSINAYNMVSNCNFLAGMTVQSIQQNVLPNGMFSTNFSGTFTGPASSLRLDSQSNYYFNQNAASLAGGATKVMIGVPTVSSVVGSQPTCNLANRGLTWNIDGGAGVADVFQVCQKDASDTYVWTTH